MQIAICPCCGKPVRPKAVTPFSAGPLAWAYGSGFPKSHSISKAIDRAAGAEREVVGYRPITYSDNPQSGGPNSNHSGQIFGKESDFGNSPITAPATPAAALWDGWGTALKPAYEPIILAMKPRDGTFAQNALEWGVAGLWIDGGRIPTNGDDARAMARCNTPRSGRMYDSKGQLGTFERSNASGPLDTNQGRWPANLLLSHAEGCECVGSKRVRSTKPGGIRNTALGLMDDDAWEPKPTVMPGYADPDGLETVEDWRCVEGCPVRMLDEQSGSSVSSGGTGPTTQSIGGRGAYSGGDNRGFFNYGDTGGASRFFYCSKASRKERNAGCEDLYWRCEGDGFVPVSRAEWERLSKRERAQGNVHPTVKPLGLVRYLCRLTRTPAGGVVLDPFMGSGSVGVGCVQEGRGFVGIDNDLTSYLIAEKRTAWAQLQPRLEGLDCAKA